MWRREGYTISTVPYRRTTTTLMSRLLLLLALLLVLVQLQGVVSAAETDGGEEDFYEVLGLSKEREDASERDIKSAWRRLSKKHHPDLAGESQRELYQRIQRAYEVLGDRKKRKVYDILGVDGLKRFEHPEDQQQQMHPFFAFFGGGASSQSADRGKNEDMLLLVPLADVYTGAAHTVRLPRTKICRACHGSGAHSRSDLQTCEHCGGSGHVVRRVQLAPGFVQQLSQACGHCGGRGRVVRRRCEPCGGRGVVRGTAALSVDVERGAAEGLALVFELEGDQQPGQVPGDVILTLATAPHPLFTRQEDHLTTTVTLTLKEALLGFERRLTHLDGHVVELTATGVTQHGDRQIIEGEGMPKHHVPSEKGNLYVIYHVELPSLLTTAQREAVERLLD
ncbi:heat shock protein DnaJ [Trypanosoma theileri]|uniref:Heat shock protein DnaJ n=1 Tax=Trypanosoma theileri TaxID=67003 RepID=A0A1X0NM12_9TRYP|nr:heat shock protein DnaJ [Trypanosoma theileri]ORC85727.1 heat shock protein DnaJ [Trypanosoma theileri]